MPKRKPKKIVAWAVVNMKGRLLHASATRYAQSGWESLFGPCRIVRLTGDVPAKKGK